MAPIYLEGSMLLPRPPLFQRPFSASPKITTPTGDLIDLFSSSIPRVNEATSTHASLLSKPRPQAEEEDLILFSPASTSLAPSVHFEPPASIAAPQPVTPFPSTASWLRHYQRQFEPQSATQRRPQQSSHDGANANTSSPVGGSAAPSSASTDVDVNDLSLDEINARLYATPDIIDTSSDINDASIASAAEVSAAVVGVKDHRFSKLNMRSHDDCASDSMHSASLKRPPAPPTHRCQCGCTADVVGATTADGHHFIGEAASSPMSVPAAIIPDFTGTVAELKATEKATLRKTPATPPLPSTLLLPTSRSASARLTAPVKALTGPLNASVEGGRVIPIATVVTSSSGRGHRGTDVDQEPAPINMSESSLTLLEQRGTIDSEARLNKAWPVMTNRTPARFTTPLTRISSWTPCLAAEAARASNRDEAKHGVDTPVPAEGSGRRLAMPLSDDWLLAENAGLVIVDVPDDADGRFIAACFRHLGRLRRVYDAQPPAAALAATAAAPPSGAPRSPRRLFLYYRHATDAQEATRALDGRLVYRGVPIRARLGATFVAPNATEANPFLAPAARQQLEHQQLGQEGQEEEPEGRRMCERMDEAWRAAAMQMLSRGKIRLMQRLAHCHKGCLKRRKRSTKRGDNGEAEEAVDGEADGTQGTELRAVQDARPKPEWDVTAGPSEFATTPPMTWAENNWW